MNRDALREELFEALGEVPVIDVHTHLVDGKLGARGLHDIVLYHMAVSDLYAAGCPSGHRLTEYPGWPTEEEARSRMEEALPYLSWTRNTSISWGIRMILKDLYGWEEPLTSDNWKKLDARIKERRDDPTWQRSILQRLHIRRVGTEYMRREDGSDDDILQYALEWAFFVRCQWGEYDTPLYELERCWGQPPSSPTPIGAGERPTTEKTIRTVDDVREAVSYYVETLAQLPPEELKDTVKLVATTIHISTDLDLRRTGDDRMKNALERRSEAGEEERSVYASYILEAFLAEMGVRAPNLTVQFSFGAEPLPHETMARMGQETLGQVAEFIGRHDKVSFQCFLASRHAHHTLCTLCRELPNLSLAGYWWHTFFPPAIRSMMDERLDMVPLNKQIGFFSDAYCAEWIYGKSLIARNCMADVLSKKVALGQYSKDDALSVARSMLFDTPQSLLGFEPSLALSG